MLYLRKTTIILACFAGSLNTCAGKVDGPAECPIDCSNAINATMGMNIKPLVPSVSISCQGSTVPKVVEVLFMIEGSGGAQEKSTPRPSISYRPVFNGSYDPGRNDQQEAEFKGIATPKEKWCSSECGVAKISVWPQCEAGKTLTHTLYITSGPIISPEITISMEDKEEEGEED